MTILSYPHGTISEADRCGNSDRPLTRRSDSAGRGLAVKATQSCSVATCDKPVESRGWCNTHYERWRLWGDVRADVPVNAHLRGATCALDGCEKVPVRGRICPMHRQRRIRTGSYDLKPRTPQARYYLKAYRPRHPLSPTTGRGYTHRMNLYDAIGPGTHPCAYCGIAVTWGRNLHVDHVDANRHNNDPANLRPCCATCNTRKSNAARWMQR